MKSTLKQSSAYFCVFFFYPHLSLSLPFSTDPHPMFHRCSPARMKFLQNVCNVIACMYTHHEHWNVLCLLYLLSAQYSGIDVRSGGCALPANHPLGCICTPELTHLSPTDGHAVGLQFTPIRACVLGDPPHTYPLLDVYKIPCGIFLEAGTLTSRVCV